MNEEKNQYSVQGFDLFRLSKSKEIVDLAPNTLRTYFKRGLNAYRSGKIVFVSKSELESFLRNGGKPTNQTPKV